MNKVSRKDTALFYKLISRGFTFEEAIEEIKNKRNRFYFNSKKKRK